MLGFLGFMLQVLGFKVASLGGLGGGVLAGVPHLAIKCLGVTPADVSACSNEGRKPIHADTPNASKTEHRVLKRETEQRISHKSNMILNKYEHFARKPPTTGAGRCRSRRARPCKTQTFRV